MSVRKIRFSVGEFYHIFNRGTDKRKLYLEPKDYKRFLALLYICNNTEAISIRDQFPDGVAFDELINFERKGTLVDIGAYCLMPNHFHLLLKEKVEGGITKFMSKLLTAYSMYFNKKNGRVGNLFQGHFGAEYLNTDEYLKYIFAYIHLNPIKLIDSSWRERKINNVNKAKNFLNEYKYSSYDEYVGEDRLEKIILTKNVFPRYFPKFDNFRNFVREWLELSKE
jgi:putative transposase